MIECSVIMDKKAIELAELLAGRKMNEALPQPTMHERLHEYEKVVILTGAGISVASGIAPFRGPGGLYAEGNRSSGYDAGIERLVYREALDTEPAAAWQFYSNLRKMAKTASPNAAHVSLAQFEKSLSHDFLLITQNIDGLHQKAGSKNVVEMHGTIHRTKCSNPECSLAGGFQDARVYREPPHCPRCGSILRPDIVMFGEMINQQNLDTISDALNECDLFIAIGTSGVVSPASQFVRFARNAGAMTIYVNVAPLGSTMEGEPMFYESVIGKAEEVLPGFLEDQPMDLKTLAEQVSNDLERLAAAIAGTS